jgi:hypothetical protein
MCTRRFLFSNSQVRAESPLELRVPRGRENEPRANKLCTPSTATAGGTAVRKITDTGYRELPRAPPAYPPIEQHDDLRE